MMFSCRRKTTTENRRTGRRFPEFTSYWCFIILFLILILLVGFLLLLQKDVKSKSGPNVNMTGELFNFLQRKNVSLETIAKHCRPAPIAGLAIQKIILENQCQTIDWNQIFESGIKVEVDQITPGKPNDQWLPGNETTVKIMLNNGNTLGIHQLSSEQQPKHGNIRYIVEIQNSNNRQDYDDYVDHVDNLQQMEYWADHILLLSPKKLCLIKRSKPYICLIDLDQSPLKCSV